MSLEIKKSQILNDSTVQIEIKQNKRQTPYYYRLPANNSDKFISETRELDKTASIAKPLAVFLGILTGTFGANIFTKKVANKGTKFLLDTATGISMAMIADSIISKFFETKQNKINRENNAYLV